MRARGFVIVGAVVLAAAATAAVFMYVRGVRTDAATSPEMVNVIVAKQDIAGGTQLTPLLSQGAFTTQAIPEDALVQGAVTQLSQLDGQQSATSILAGEQISPGRLRGDQELGGGLLEIPEGHEAVTISLDASRSGGGFVRSGDHVTIYATLASPDDRTVVLVPQVQILRAGPAGATGGDGGLVTLALTPEDAQKVVFAVERASVWFALLAPGQEGIKRPPVSYSQVSR